MYTVLRYTNREYWRSELRVATGRSAIKHLLNVAEPPHVLMPSYVPEGIIGPCKGTRTTFYKLNPDLTPDLDNIRETIECGSMVVVIHYFGYLTDCSKIREIVNDAGGILFEDCAHTLYDEATKARYADVALWSLNKFMPVTDGAILRSRDRKINVHPIFAPQVFNPDILRVYLNHLDINARMVNEDDISLLTESEAEYESYYSRINTDYRPYGQSIESKFIESQFDVEKETKVRATNAWRMAMVLPGLRHETHNLPQFAFPVMLKHPDHKEAITERLTKLGILPSTLVAKWDHVPRDAAFKIELDFMDRHLLLPLGDPMNTNLIGQIAGAL